MARITFWVGVATFISGCALVHPGLGLAALGFVLVVFAIVIENGENKGG